MGRHRGSPAWGRGALNTVPEAGRPGPGLRAAGREGLALQQPQPGPAGPSAFRIGPGWREVLSSDQELGGLLARVGGGGPAAGREGSVTAAARLRLRGRKLSAQPRPHAPRALPRERPLPKFSLRVHWVHP